jgi:hypothetical protein
VGVPVLLCEPFVELFSKAAKSMVSVASLLEALLLMSLLFFLAALPLPLLLLLALPLLLLSARPALDRFLLVARFPVPRLASVVLDAELVISLAGGLGVVVLLAAVPFEVAILLNFLAVCFAPLCFLSAGEFAFDAVVIRPNTCKGIPVRNNRMQ